MPASTSVCHDGISSRTAFSYAQAAKRKNTPPISGHTVRSPLEAAKETTNPAVTSPTHITANEKINWADDAADATTIVGDHEMIATSQCSESNTQDGAALTDARKEEEESQSASPQLNASTRSSTVRDDDGGACAISTRTENTSWRRNSQDEDPSPTTPRDSNAQRLWGDDLNSGVKSSAPTLVEAPPPTVNFWTKRAQDAKERQGPGYADDGGTKPDPTKRFSHPFSHGENKAIGRTSADRRESETKAIRSRNSVGPGTVPDGRRGSLKQQVAPHPSQFPSLQDSRSWPTPETARGEGRRKANVRHSERPEKLDGERSNGSIAKSHGKSEWVPVPFIPTVKFETPIPTAMRRGQRPGVRGGREVNSRGASVNGVSSSRTSPPTSGESTNAAPSRDRSTANIGRSPSLARKHTSFKSEANADSTTPGRGRSLASSTLSHSREASNADIHHGPLNTPSDSKYVDHGVDEKATTDKLDFEGYGAPSMAHSWSNSNRNGSYKNVDGRFWRRNSRAGEVESNLARPGDRKRAGSINGNYKVGRSDRRPENSVQHSDTGPEYYGNLPLRDRGEGRAERGRGNHRSGAFFSPHPPSLQINNGQMFYPSTPNSAKAVTFHSQYPGPSTFPRTGRGVGGPRSASIPSDVQFGRHQPQYPGSPTATPFTSPGYDFSPMTPTSPLPINQFTNHILLMNGVATQLNYYFSLDNLCKDVFLRRHMDSQGFVPLRLVADFARMKQLTTDFELIKNVASHNPDFELHINLDGNVYLRKRQGWADFVLAMNEREPTAQHEGPTTGERVVQAGMMPSSLPNGYNPEPMYQPMQPASLFIPFAPVPSASPTNGFPKALNNRQSQSAIDSHVNLAPPTSEPMRTPGVTPETEDEEEPDSFPDEKIDNQLTLFTRVSQHNHSLHGTHGPFSNGNLHSTHAPTEESSEDGVSKSEPKFEARYGDYGGVMIPNIN